MDTEDQSNFSVWVDHSEKIASFHRIEESTPMSFQKHDTFIAYLYTLAERGYRFQ